MRKFLLATTALLAVTVTGAGTAAAAPIQHALGGSRVLIDNVIGDVTVVVAPGAQGVQISATGDDRFTSLLSFSQNGDRAEIRMGDLSYNSDENLQTLRLTVTVAPGTDLAIDDLIGNAEIGDLRAPVAIDAVAGRITIGTVTTASLESSGSADIQVTEATGSLSIDTSGSGEVKVGKAGATSITISGSGDAEIGTVTGGLGIDISGSADVDVQSVNGPTAISVAGSGEIYIASGRADPFAADISGGGSVTFGGTAVNPQISSSGSADICLAAAEGTIQSDGDITISPTACKRS